MTYDKNTLVFEPIPTHFNFKDRTGLKVNDLTFLGLAGRNKKNQPIWYIKCHCENIFIAHGTNIINGHTRSCGCLATAEAKSIRATTHGMRHTPEYVAFAHAKDRCNNPNDKRYKDYGGRGIEFRFNSFEEFFAEVGLRPEEKTKIDRIDVNGHYEKGNLRWVDDIESAGNTRANRQITHNGQTKILIEWSRETGISPSLILYRLSAGWSVEDALTTPSRLDKFKTCNTI